MQFFNVKKSLKSNCSALHGFYSSKYYVLVRMNAEVVIHFRTTKCLKGIYSGEAA